METDGGLVENVEDTAEVGPQLRGEADALRFTAGQGGHAAAELQIPKTDFPEKLQAFPDLRQDVPGDLGVAPGHLHLVEVGLGGFHRTFRKETDRRLACLCSSTPTIH